MISLRLGLAKLTANTVVHFKGSHGGNYPIVLNSIYSCSILLAVWFNNQWCCQQISIFPNSCLCPCQSPSMNQKMTAEGSVGGGGTTMPHFNFFNFFNTKYTRYWLSIICTYKQIWKYDPVPDFSVIICSIFFRKWIFKTVLNLWPTTWKT